MANLLETFDIMVGQVRFFAVQQGFRIENRSIIRVIFVTFGQSWKHQTMGGALLLGMNSITIT